MKENKIISSKKACRAWREIGFLAVLCLAVGVFFLPIGLGWHGICLDDVRILAYPNAVFQAKCLQDGIIPLWEPHTFAGAYPFYLRLSSMNFYLPQWLAGLIGTTHPSDQAYRQLVLIPVLGHYLWAVVGGFVLGCFGLRLSRPGAVMLSLFYTLSTSMLAGMMDPPMTAGLAWYPWLIALVLIYARRRSGVWLVLGALVMALAAPAWPYYTMQGLFLVGLFGGASVIREWVIKGGRSARRLTGGLLAMAVIGFLLAAPYWWSLAEGTGYVRRTINMSYDFLTAGPRSLPWRWLATFFIPELFSSTNFAYYWGVAASNKMYWCEAFLTRGMLLWLPAVLAIWLGIRMLLKKLMVLLRGVSGVSSGEGEGGLVLKKRFFGSDGDDPHSEYYLWTWLATGLLVLSILLMLGDHTPVFGLLYKSCPLFRMPYATRWHPLFTMALAVLTGIGVTRLWDRKSGEPVATRLRIITYLLFIILLAGAAVFLPPGYWRELEDFGWFLKAPVLYWLASSVMLGALCVWWRPRWAGRMIVIFAFVGLIRSAVWDAYRPMGLTWTAEQDYARGPEESKMYEFAAFASGYTTNPLVRTGYSRILADNGAMVYGGYNLLGWPVKPMLPRMYHILEKLCDGWPNDLIFRDPTLPFTRNMSVGFWWYNRPVPPDEDWEYVASASPGFGLHLFRIPRSLPRVFTLDRLHPASGDDQLYDLLYRDLHEVVIVDADDEAAAAYPEDRRGPAAYETGLDYFTFLQEKNIISGTDFSHPNRVDIDLDITVPAMLVLTDAWHPGWQATDNGRPVIIHRVNCLQRGIWLGEGRHRVRMSFRPTAFYIGRWFSLGGVIVSLVILGWKRTKIIMNRK